VAYQKAIWPSICFFNCCKIAVISVLALVQQAQGQEVTTRTIQIPLHQIPGIEAPTELRNLIIEVDEVTLPNGEKFIIFARDNCGERKREFTRRWRHVRFGSCNHALPSLAQAEAATLLALDFASGDCELGQPSQAANLTVRHKAGPIVWLTYLAAAGCGQR
jgi:hypothetical protein